MHRWLFVAAVVVLAATGCSLQTPSPAPSPSELVLAAHVVGASISTTARCDGPRATVSASRAPMYGPSGSLQATGSDAVALTFDDGPDPVNTPRLLDILAECGVKATFCLVGNKVSRHVDLVRRIVAEGHTLCNHTWQHNTALGTLGQPAILDDLQRTNNVIHSAVPDAPISYFRAPGGKWTTDYVSVAQQLGMASIDWDVDPWDWNFAQNGRGEAMTNHIIGYVKQHLRPGSIVLSHDNDKPATVEAYRRLLPWLTARYTLIALPPTLT